MHARTPTLRSLGNATEKVMLTGRAHLLVAATKRCTRVVERESDSGSAMTRLSRAS